MIQADLLTTGPWVLVSIAGTWLFKALAHRREIQKIRFQHAASVDVSRDDLAIELLSSARAEVVTARGEMSGLRDEINSLRAMEQHFYHFQQALEHLSAVLFARNQKERTLAERNARAFLTRMDRLQTARGTIANEVQRVDSALAKHEKTIRKEGGAV